MADFLIDFFTYSPTRPMLFTGIYFWFFFVAVLVGLCFVCQRQTARSIYLALFSLFFYYKSSGLFFFLLIFSSVFDFSLGLAMGHYKQKAVRLALVTTSISVNLLILLYFKYTYFITNLINDFFGTSFVVKNLFAQWCNGLFDSHLDISEIILPAGVSFFTFQAISYALDVYRRKLEPTRSYFDFAFFVTFFPQLIAGPIVRAYDFIPQISKPYKLTKEDFNWAFFLIMNGLVKKMLISDYISTNFVDRVFDNPLSYTGFENLMSVYGYTIQIYCDFSGYTDIAIGVALLIGFKLPINFDSPYKSQNITEFWRRWHISLSTWLKDYLYISLGGNRKGKVRTYVNLILTMVLGGLWHGANLRFIIWGTLHGFALALHKMWLKYCPLANINKRWWLIISSILTFHFVSFAWMFFRAPSVASVGEMLKKIATDFNIFLIPDVIWGYKVVFLLTLLGFAIHWLKTPLKLRYTQWIMDLPVWAKVTMVVIVVVVLYQAKSAGVQPFIYFQF